MWCQGHARPTAGAAGVYKLDLTALAADCSGLNDVRTVNLCIGSNQRQDIDAVTVS